MNRNRALGASLAAVLALGAVAACAPPAKDNSSGGGGSDAATATSAADVGGMDALVKAAKKEGTLNVIALPPDWANYGNDHQDASRTSTASRSTPTSRTRPARTRSTPRTSSRAPDRAPDVFDLGQSVALANTSLFAPYKVATLDDDPRRLQGPERHLGQRLRRLHVDRLRLQQGART